MPSHWKVERIKWLAQYRVSSVNKISDAEEIPVRLCNYTDVYNNRTVRPEMPLMRATATEEEIEKFGLRIGDVLITKDSEDWADIAVPALVTSTAPDFICGYHLAIIRPDSRRLDPRFLLRALQAPPVNYQFQVAATGVTRYGLPKSAIGDARIPIASIEQQAHIANFLELETARIEGLIENKKRLIGMVREKRAARIADLALRGIGTTHFKCETQLPTIGALPKHWQVSRIKVLFQEIDERVSESSARELLTVSHITGITPRSQKPDVTMFMAETLDGYKRCQKNDLVINTMWAWMGALGVSKYDGVVSPGYNVYRFKRQVIPEYFDCLYRTPQYIAEFTRWSKGVWSSRLRLYPDEFFQILTPVPPLDEQEKIVKAIREETGGYEDSIRILEESIDRLSQYRTALITSAVTGQIDVREYRTQGVGSCP